MFKWQLYRVYFYGKSSGIFFIFQFIGTTGRLVVEVVVVVVVVEVDSVGVGDNVVEVDIVGVGDTGGIVGIVGTVGAAVGWTGV